MTDLDTKQLLKRGNSYSLRYVIPKEQRRQHGGRREIVKALGNSCLRTAVTLRDEALRKLLTQTPKRASKPASKPRGLCGTPAARRVSDGRQRISQASHEWLLMCDGITPATKYGYRPARPAQLRHG